MTKGNTPRQQQMCLLLEPMRTQGPENAAAVAKYVKPFDLLVADAFIHVCVASLCVCCADDAL